MATAFSLDSFLKTDKLDQARAVKKGLPVKAIKDLLADKVVSMADLAQIVAPRRTLDRRLKANTSLSPEESDRLATFASVLAEATRLFGSRADAMRWLSESKRAFGGDRPIDLLRSRAGARAVEEFFIRASHGMLA